MPILALLSLTIAPAPVADRAAVLSALLGELALEQRRPHRRAANRPVCVVAKLDAAPLVGQRQPSPGDMKFDAPMGQPRRPWKPDTEAEARARLWPVDPDAPPAERQAQQAIQDAALRVSEASPSDTTVGDIAPAWLAGGQRIDTRACAETIRLSEPAIALDHAFVDVGIECGALCGMQATYVLRRRDGRWRVVDGRIHLIS